MRALRFYGIHDLRTEETEIPECGEDEALVRIAYAGICGSDLHIYNKGMFIQNIPETMGHEFDGVIEKTGSGVKNFKPGDKVTANPMVPCGTCNSCLKGSFNTCAALGFIGEVSQGCFAQYIAVKEEKLIRVPDSADLKQIALSEPLAVAVNICRRASFRPGDRVALIGAGPIGLLTIALAKQVYGVDDITAVDLSESRLKLAVKLGASKAVQKPDENERFNKVIEAAGAPATFAMAAEHVEANGFLYVVSIFEKDFIFDINALVAGQITLVGCNVYTDEDLKEAVSLIAEKRVDISPVITGEYTLEEGKEAFELLSSVDKSAAKILFRM